MAQAGKDIARKEAFARRKSAHAAGAGEALDRLSSVLSSFSGEALAGYMPIRTEIDPLPAMARFAGPVGVPVIVAEGAPLAFHLWTPGCAMVSGPFGAAIPAQGEEMTPSVLIVPMLAFDRRGFRLGYGGGFYDRTLARLRATHKVTAIGFAYAAQEAAEVPTEPTDQPLDLIVTEAETFIF